MSRDILVETVTEALADPTFQRTLADALSARLQHKLAGESLYVPKGTRHQRQARDQQIRQALAAGTPLDELQITYRVSKRTLYRIKHRKAKR